MNLLRDVAGRSAQVTRSSTPEHKAEWGQFFTPAAVAAFMASLIEVDEVERPFRILDPGAGTGILGIAAALHVLQVSESRRVHVVAVETEGRVQDKLRASLDLLCRVAPDRVTVEVLDSHFLDLGQPSLTGPRVEPFDLAIANPPYFKMSPTDSRGGDAPNIYARFMEVSADLLMPGGQLVFIVPRSFASGYYFRKFRRRFHQRTTLHQVHVFESRRDVFKAEGVLQESIVVKYVKGAPAMSAITITASKGTVDIGDRTCLVVPAHHVVTPGDPREVISLPATPEELSILEHVHAWPDTLRSLDMEISTGPVVAFRARSETITEPNGKDVAPLLWMNHIKPGKVTWPLNPFRKPQYIKVDAPSKLLVERGNYVLLRRFSAKEDKRRLTAAFVMGSDFDSSVLGLENHLNFLHRPGGSLSPEEAAGLCVLLSSTVLDQFFRISSGNTQVSATEIRAMPLPPKAVIESMGRRYLATPNYGFDEQMIEEFPWVRSTMPRSF